MFNVFFDIKDFTASDDFYFKGMELFAENLDKVWFYQEKKTARNAKLHFSPETM